MPDDPELDAIVADLAALPAAEVVTLASSGVAVSALFDDEDAVVQDPSGRHVQITETVVRYRAPLLTAPAVGSSVTTTASDGTVTTWLVRDARKDPGNPGMVRLNLVAS